jgi:K+-transporting ATPase ATPase C chain
MKLILQAFLILVVLTLLTGIVYPLAITGVAVLCFPEQSHGSMSVDKGHATGSYLVGQNFSDRKNFWPRPSATSYSAMPSGGSNINPISSSLRATIDARRDTFLLANGLVEKETVPGDMLFASGSGLDPDISPQAARLQIDRVAHERNFTNEQKLALVALVDHSIIPRQLGFLGSERVNVLRLNQNVEQLEKSNGPQRK